MADLLRDPAFYRDVLTWLNPWAIDRVIQQEDNKPDGWNEGRPQQGEEPSQDRSTLEENSAPDPLPATSPPPAPDRRHAPVPLPATAPNESETTVTVESFNHLLLTAVERNAAREKIEMEIQAYETALQKTCSYEEDKGPFMQFLIDHSEHERSLKPLARCYKKHVDDAQARTAMVLFDRDTAEQRLHEETRALKRMFDQIHRQTPAFIDLLDPGNLGDPQRYDKSRSEIMVAMKKHYSHETGLAEAEEHRNQARESYMKFNSKPAAATAGASVKSVAERRQKLEVQLERSRKERRNWRIAEKRHQLFQQNQTRREKELLDGPASDWLRTNKLLPFPPVHYEPKRAPRAAASEDSDSADSDAAAPDPERFGNPPSRFKVYVPPKQHEPPVEEGLEESEAMQELNDARRLLREARRELRTYKTWWLHTLAEHMYAHPETSRDKFEDDWPQVHSDDPKTQLQQLRATVIDCAEHFNSLGGAAAAGVQWADLVRVDPSLNEYYEDEEDGDGLSARYAWEKLPDESHLYRSAAEVKSWVGAAAEAAAAAAESEADVLAGPERTPDPGYHDEAARRPSPDGTAGPSSKGESSRGKRRATSPPARRHSRDARRARIREIVRNLQEDGEEVPDFDAHWRRLDEADEERSRM